jgi:hypothetical protein
MAVCLFLNTGGFSQSVYWSDHSSSVQSTYRSGHISSVQSVSQAVQSVYRSGHGGSVQPTYQPGHISSVQSVQSVYWSGHSSSVHAVPPVCWSGHGSSFQFSWVGLLVRSRQSSRDRFSRGWRWFGECVSAFCWWQHLRPGPRTHKGRGGDLVGTPRAKPCRGISRPNEPAQGQRLHQARGGVAIPVACSLSR